MSLLPKIQINSEFSQLVYAVIVIILVPASLAFNTIFLLTNIQKDIDYELNNKALMVESVIGVQLQDHIDDPAVLEEKLRFLITKLPDVRAIEVFRFDKDDITPVVTTSESTKAVFDPVLNQLAWGSNESYSKQIVASVGSSGDSERVWLVASPLSDANNNKVGVINLYMSAAQIDAITGRTVRDSLLVLFITMVGISLLLLNHFRFFEISILFKKLSDLDKLKDDFISMASHELRAPLTVISSYAYVLSKNPLLGGDVTASRDISIIYQSAERLKVLIEDILDVSRIEQRRMNLQKIPIDLASLIESIVQEFSQQAHTKNLRLIYEKSQTSVFIEGDPSKLKQVFYNLVSNAIKYTIQGEVKIYHQVSSGKVKTLIKDTGVGMTEEERGRLFQKFSRMQNDQTKNIPGTGLGLWITKQLIEMMKGTVSVESVKGQGSQFIVSFPLYISKGSAGIPTQTPGLIVKTNNS